MDVDLDNLTFEIRKSTSKHYRRAKIPIRKGKARIIITDQEKWYRGQDLCCMLNHEFIHWILYCTIGEKWSGKKYDRFLEALGWYWHERLLELWL